MIEVVGRLPLPESWLDYSGALQVFAVGLSPDLALVAAFDNVGGFGLGDASFRVALVGRDREQLVLLRDTGVPLPSFDTDNGSVQVLQVVPRHVELDVYRCLIVWVTEDFDADSISLHIGQVEVRGTSINWGSPVTLWSQTPRASGASFQNTGVGMHIDEHAKPIALLYNHDTNHGGTRRTLYRLDVSSLTPGVTATATLTPRAIATGNTWNPRIFAVDMNGLFGVTYVQNEITGVFQPWNHFTVLEVFNLSSGIASIGHVIEQAVTGFSSPNVRSGDGFAFPRGGVWVYPSGTPAGLTIDARTVDVVGGQLQVGEAIDAGTMGLDGLEFRFEGAVAYNTAEGEEVLLLPCRSTSLHLRDSHDELTSDVIENPDRPFYNQLSGLYDSNYGVWASPSSPLNPSDSNLNVWLFKFVGASGGCSQQGVVSGRDLLAVDGERTYVYRPEWLAD